MLAQGWPCTRIIQRLAWLGPLFVHSLFHIAPLGLSIGNFWFQEESGFDKVLVSKRNFSSSHILDGG
jgi:hypothetical protein